jgi:O-antigen ligase
MEIFLFLFGYFLLSLYRLPWAVLLLIVGLPSYIFRFEVFGLPSTVLEGMILISLAVWIWTETNFLSFLKGEYGLRDYLKNRSRRGRYPFDIEIIFLLLVSFLAVAVSGFSLDALGLWRAYFLEPLLVFILVLNIFQSRQDVYKVLSALSVSALVISVFAIVQKFTGWLIPAAYSGEGAVDRVTSFYSYPNAVGLFVAPISLVALGLVIERAKQIQEVYKTKIEVIPRQYWITLIIGLLTVVSSWSAIWWARSEGAAAGVIIGVTVLGLFYGKKTRLAFMAVLIVISACVYFNPPVKEYVVEKATLSDLSGEIRKVQWSGAWEMLTDGHRWLTGAGLAGYQETIAPYRSKGLFFNKDDDPDFRRKIVLFNEEYKAQFWQPLEIYMYPHNIVLNFWTELGLIGMLLFVWIFVKYFYYGIKVLAVAQPGLTLALITALIAIIIHGLVDVPYFKNDLAVQFWILVTVMSLLHHREYTNLYESTPPPGGQGK